jgi:hypothetical protein
MPMMTILDGSVDDLLDLLDGHPLWKDARRHGMIDYDFMLEEGNPNRGKLEVTFAGGERPLRWFAGVFDSILKPDIENSPKVKVKVGEIKQERSASAQRFVREFSSK